MNSYDSFGNPANASFPTRYQFTGREYDNFTGLQYSRARWYDPKIGRFISEDPIGFAGGINGFAYVENNPQKYSDPSGYCPCKNYPNGANENFGMGYKGRVDAFNGGEGFEIHVYDPTDAEIGIVGGRYGWIAKHGLDGVRPPGVPDSVINQVNGLNVGELRGRGLIGPKGTVNIRSGSYLFNGRVLFGIYGALALADGLLLDYGVYQRAQQSGRTWGEQFDRDNEDFEYIMTPVGLLPNTHYCPKS